MIKAESERCREHTGVENALVEREKEKNLGKKEDKIQKKEKQMGKEKSIRGGGNEVVSLLNEFGLKSG